MSACKKYKIGILGVGQLAEFIIEGIMRKSTDVEFVLSPRSAQRAQKLAENYSASVAVSNQAVVDSCEMILVCLPAAEGATILEGLTFRFGQSVLSAMAGLSHARLSAIIAPATGFCTMMPGYANSIGEGPSLLYPADTRWHEFLSLLGKVFPLETPEIYDAASVFGAFSGATFAYMQQIMHWFEAKGLSAETARHLVAETLRGNAAVAASVHAPMAAIAKDVATPGGITEQCVSSLNAQGALSGWVTALDAVFERVRHK
jgi:pyrroline-5-carboxylate reductase